jgi:dihydrodipicolinate synthase/N-acetylneuraminate lyase
MADQNVSAQRAAQLERIFPAGVPRLWCPSLTHYDPHGAIDSARIIAHLKHIAPHVKGLLIPGSTGDGWELAEHETRQVLDIALDQAAKLKLHLLIGVLKFDVSSTLSALGETAAWVKARHGPPAAKSSKEPAGKDAAPCFTVCPPRGRDLPAAAIESALVSMLETGHPLALYQLPQITQNEMSPGLLGQLAERFANFILFKDSSGADRVATAGKDLAGVFLMRGAECDYARWLKSAGGPYDGFLLSTANCFAAPLAQIILDLSEGRPEAAQQMSQRLTAVVNAVFQLVVGLPAGNPFVNANKAIDHFLHMALALWARRRRVCMPGRNCRSRCCARRQKSYRVTI